MFEALATASMKITVFWDVTMCNLLEDPSDMKMETAGSSER
jgi:hypothetical protein